VPAALLLSGLTAAVCGPHSAHSAPVDLELTTEHAHLMLGEPVVAVVEITNHTGVAITVPTLFDPTYGVYRYWITSPDGSKKRFEPAWLDEMDRAVTAPVASGGKIRGYARLFHASNGTPFDRAGAYKISVTSGTMQSPEWSLAVDAPPDDRARRAAELMLSPDVTLFLLAGGGETLKNARPNLELVSSSFAGTAVAPYADFALGVYYAQDSRDFVHKNVRPADPVRSRFLLERSAGSNTLPPLFRQRAYSHLIQIALDRNDAAGAESYITQYQSRYGREPDAADAVGSMRQLIEKSGIDRLRR
jgi:hypothetical protein